MENSKPIEILANLISQKLFLGGKAPHMRWKKHQLGDEEKGDGEKGDQNATNTESE